MTKYTVSIIDRNESVVRSFESYSREEALGTYEKWKKIFSENKVTFHALAI